MDNCIWVSVDVIQPPENVPVMTKLDDGKGVRNQQLLKRRGGMWILPDTSVYTYYEPTHWLLTV